MTTLSDLIRERFEDVETSGGVVRVASRPFQELAPYFDAEPAKQAAGLISTCVVDPAMSAEDANKLPPDIVMVLVEACLRVNGLNAPD